MRMDDKCVFTTCRIGSSQHLFGLRRGTCLRFIPIKESCDNVLQDGFKICNMPPLGKTRSREKVLSCFRNKWRAQISNRRLGSSLMVGMADINLDVEPVKWALCWQKKTDVCEKKLKRFAVTLTHTHTHTTELIQDSTKTQSKVIWWNAAAAFKIWEQQTCF